MPTSPNKELRLNRLLQLCSANLPVGGFSFSQGLEYAVELGWLNNADETRDWIDTNLQQAIACTDLAILGRLYTALSKQDEAGFEYWNQHLIACRESHELLLADVAMGKALVRLLKQIDRLDTSAYNKHFGFADMSFVSAFAIAAFAFELELEEAQSGYCWTVIDNQVAAATKLVPLGQTQSQNLLYELSETVESAMTMANGLSSDEIGGSLPRLAMASAWHETQYSRLFRS